jgi:Flp pilus assembly protein CpaB
MKIVGPLSLRLRRVNANDPKNNRDDTCELIANTDTQSMTVTLDESGAPQFVEDWRFQAVDVQPTSGTKTTQGTARIRIRYVPASTRGQDTGTGSGLIPQSAQVTLNTSSRDMKNVGPLSLRLRRVNANEAQNDRDDTCELIVNTDTQSMTITLREGGLPKFVEDWRFQAMDVRPAAGANSTQGTAHIRITRPSAGT